MLDSQPSSSSSHLLDHAAQTMNRPQGPGRLPSFNKRHASFDSPREIPLPSPLSPGGRDGRGYFDLPKADGREDVRKEMKEREKFTQSRTYHHPHHSKDSRPHHSPHSSIDRSTSPQPVFPHPRPYSLPHSSSSSSSSGGNDTDTQFSTPNEHESSSLGLGLPKPDRSSSASLPLPAQIPYHTLPRTTEPPPPNRPSLAPPHSASGSFASRLPYTEDDEDGESYMTALRRSTKSQLDSHPPVIMEESGLSRSASIGSAQAVAPPNQPASASTSTPVPPPSEEVWRNPPPVQPPGPRTTPSPRPVMGGVVNPSDLPPVLPPQRMRGADPSTGNPSSRVGHGNGSGGGGGGLPHTPPNPFSQTQTQTQVQAPPAYAPFLSPLPPPPERCWIEVETTPHAYKLNIRLEGFKRDGITLATRRRRILHVVADSWDADGGGHFERRISFGYDADLVGVRAEFDGEWLRVSVPRRTI